jgi:hypothetical protein
MSPEQGEQFHVVLGLYIALVVISIAWNIDWRHYMLYWIRSAPPHDRRWAVGIRILFLVGLLGTTWQLVSSIIDNRPSIEDLGLSVLYGLIVIVIFFAGDAIFRWRRARSSKSNKIER